MLINPLFLSVLNNEGILLSLSVPAQRNITDYSSRQAAAGKENNTEEETAPVMQGATLFTRFQFLQTLLGTIFLYMVCDHFHHI